MNEHGMYFGKNSFYQIVKNVGGVWNDAKERPLVCVIKSTEYDDLYWAVPVGNWEHRDIKAQQRIQDYINMPQKDIRSCFYHIGNTDIKSIFFISDILPVTDTYIDRDYLSKFNKQHIIKNKILLLELEYKVKRILSFENRRPNYFRQHITDVKNYLVNEMMLELEAATAKEEHLH